MLTETPFCVITLYNVEALNRDVSTFLDEAGLKFDLTETERFSL